MSIFKEMWPRTTFETARDYTELRRMLREAMNGGFVEEIPVMRTGRQNSREKWYRAKDSGDIYSLMEPDERGPYWQPIEMQDLVGDGETIQ